MAHANGGDYDGARDLLDRMILLDGDIKPDVASYNTVISCADPRDALSLIREMRLTRRNRGFGVVLPNSVTYVNAISRCRKATLNGDDPDMAFEIAMTLLDMAREDGNDAGKGIDLNVYVYSASIWIAEAVGDYRTAARLLREMGCQPNGVCYDGVISALSKHGLHREALFLYYEMISKGLVATRKTYQRLAYVIEYSRDPELSRPKKIALMAGVLSKLPVKDRNVRVGGPLFESVIRNHGKATDPRTAYQSAKMAFDSIVGPVDDACLSAMLRVCSTAEPVRWNEALMLIHSSDIVREASRPGFVSSRALSLAVIACAKADQYEEALNLIELYGMRAADGISIAYRGESVSVKAMNAVISACGRRSRPDVAVRLLNDMETMCGIEPEETSYRLAIIACNQAEHRGKHRQTTPVGSELKWWECALSLLRRMKEDGLKPSMQTISSVVSACEAAGEWQRALGVLQSIFPLLGEGEIEQMGIPEPPNLYCLNAAIAACEKGGAWVEALQLYENLQSMQKSKNAVRPNFITVNSLLIALERAQQNELAGSIYRDAVKERIVSPWRHRYDNDGVLRRMMVSKRELRLVYFLLSFFLCDFDHRRISTNFPCRWPRSP
jgi:pentatricopeptide repeat domain-containing protein 1